MKTARINSDVDSKGNRLNSNGKTPTVFINNQPIALINSSNSKGSKVTSGSPNVYAQNEKVARFNDAFASGTKINTGSDNVLTNLPNP
jgi:uncharacterized Zn-binding protein involved in type VI secretion